MDRLRNIIRFFNRWPKGVELLKIDQRGCMATDWHITDRGRIVRKEYRQIRVVNGSRTVPLAYYIARRADGTEFDAIVDRCNHNPDRECSRFAGEDLTGKIYEGI